MDENIKNTDIHDEEEQPTMRCTIGGTTYIVTAHFSEKSGETMNDKISRIIKRDIEIDEY